VASIEYAIALTEITARKGPGTYTTGSGDNLEIHDYDAVSKKIAEGTEMQTYEKVKDPNTGITWKSVSSSNSTNKSDSKWIMIDDTVELIDK
jgi:hypothetical protein